MGVRPLPERQVLGRAVGERSARQMSGVLSPACQQALSYRATGALTLIAWHDSMSDGFLDIAGALGTDDSSDMRVHWSLTQ
jgi:hypothetical protein